MSRILEKLLAQRRAKAEKLAEKRRKRRIKENTKRRTKKRRLIRKEKEIAKATQILKIKEEKAKERRRRISQKRNYKALQRAKRKYWKKVFRNLRIQKTKEARRLERHILFIEKKLERLEEEYYKKQEIRTRERRILTAKRHVQKSMALRRQAALNELISEEAKEGNKYSDYCLIITRNYKRIKTLGNYKWSKDVYGKYNIMVHENENKVKFPKEVIETIYDGEKKIEKRIIEEIMIIEKCTNSDNAFIYRNEEGRLEENIISDAPDYKIIAKHPWLTEEAFSVIDNNYNTEKKTFSYIKNEMILNNVSLETMKRIFTYKNYLIIQENNDISAVLCKTNKNAIRLYGALQKDIKDNKYVFFSGSCAKRLYGWVNDLIKQKRENSRNASENFNS